MVFVLILSIFLWLGGYLITAHLPNTGVSSNELDAIIAPPRWLYYLCGAPFSKEYPRGAMRVGAFRVQILGAILMIYTIYSRIWKTSEMENIIGFTLSCVIAFMLTSYVSKKYSFKDQTKNRKKKKDI